jgi:hypothetical protein
VDVPGIERVELLRRRRQSQTDRGWQGQQPMRCARDVLEQL